MSHNYLNKVILAPMVRIGTLPMRLLALSYGADLVYTEEIIDYKLLRCKRIDNEILGTIDYVDEDQNVILRTCPAERQKLIVQLGTCDPGRALKAALMIQEDVAGIDINMGCPKEFSVKGGMGVALLDQPDKVRQILTTLVHNLQLPVTCKIRLLPSIEESIKLVQLIQQTGVAAVAIHGRTRHERPQHANRDDEIKQICQAVDIPIIANGGSADIHKYEDIELFRLKTCAASVMLARAAEKNSSIFKKQKNLDAFDIVITNYLKLAIDFDNSVANTKYCIQQMLGSLQDTPRGKLLLATQQMKEIW